MDLLTCILNDYAQYYTYFPQTYQLASFQRPLPIEVNAPWIALPRMSLAERRFNDSAGRRSLASDVIAASSEFGMFEVVDHNISEMVLWNAMRASEGFFELPSEQLRAFSQPPMTQYMLYSSSLMNVSGMETRHFWRDALTVGLNSPLQVEGWPSQPPYFRDDVMQFASNVRLVEAKVLDLISRGLELRPDYFNTKRLNASSAIVVNRYPRCPEPTWTCGMPKHVDPNLLTISIQGGADGLQIWHNGQWKLVVPSRNALLVTLGRQMEIVSNGILRGAEHRVIVNSERARTSISYFTGPYDKCKVGPAQELTRSIPRRYQDIQYDEFVLSHIRDHNSASILPRFMS